MRISPRYSEARTLSLSSLRAILVLGAMSSACSSNDSSPPNNGVPSPDSGGSVEDAGASDDRSSTDTDELADTITPTDGIAPTGPCSMLPSTVVYIESGDTQENLLKNLGRHLRDTANIAIVYNLTGSCTLTNDIYTGAKMVPNGTLKYVPSSKENPSWTPASPPATCTTPVDGAPIDVAISALFVQSCGLGGPPAGSNLALIQGPIQAYTFVVPTASDQTAIWAEEAYYAFGFGNQNPLAPQYNPWNNEQFMFIRPATKSTLVATAKNIALPPNKWKGVTEEASSDVVNAVTTSALPEATIGILGAEVYDANRGKGIKTLAFQAFGQNAAYYADSTSTAYDKQNLRDGHYTLWSPTVYITKVDGQNVPADPPVKYVLDLVLGKLDAAPPAGGTTFNGLADVANVGLIPDCAMQVTRNEDGGELRPYTPDAPCTCYYLTAIAGAAGAPPNCAACTLDADCVNSSRRCNHGFCEPRETPPIAGDAGGGCFGGTPTTHSEIINACTAAQRITKSVVLIGDGGLEPPP
jgi:hypothetical protein